MLNRIHFRRLAVAILAFASVGVIAHQVVACTRAVYFGKDGMIVTGRTMDWKEDLKSNMWIFPAGMDRDGGLGPTSYQWKSKYGSVVLSAYEAATCDGMNEHGLVVNALYLAESEYATPGDKRPGMSVGAWSQYVLDSFSNVDEAVMALQNDAFQVVAPTLPNGAAATIHFSISDPSGDSAICEYLGGKLVIHHDRKFQVMTNSPTFDHQIALNEYWQQIGGNVMLPGTNRAADRFVRAAYYIDACDQSADAHEAVAAVSSVMCNVSVPRGISTPDQPNIASTIWRSVANQKDRIYYFENTDSPGAIWVELGKIDFSAGSGVRKLTMVGEYNLGGNQTANFKQAEAFKFLAPEIK